MHAQQEGKIARVGVLGPGLDNPVTGPGYKVFLSELRKLGFTEGQNVIVEYRRTDEGVPKAFTGANEFVAAKADVLVANGPEISLQAATAARPAVPIVMLANNYDPFARGYVKSLAQPGGNVTGLFYRQPGIGCETARAAGGGVPRADAGGRTFGSVAIRIVERTHYYARPGLATEVLDQRRKASAVRVSIGLPAGEIFVKHPGGDGSEPDVAWQCTFADAAARVADLAARAASAEFESVRVQMRKLYARFERQVFAIVSL